MDNLVVQTDIAEVLGEIRQELRTIGDRLNKIEVGQAEIKGELKTTDERLSGQIKALDTKVDQLDKRIGNSELTNRGILIGLIVVILGGAAKFFGIVGNPRAILQPITNNNKRRPISGIFPLTINVVCACCKALALVIFSFCKPV